MDEKLKKFVAKRYIHELADKCVEFVEREDYSEAAIELQSKYIDSWNTTFLTIIK